MAPSSAPGARPHGWFDLLAWSSTLRALARSRAFPVFVSLPLLACLVGLLATGIWGTTVGSHNALVVFVWIGWWVLLIGVLAPLASRSWCAVCPVPLLGDWFQRGTLSGVRLAGRQPPGRGLRIGRNGYFGLGLRWPRRLSNIWLPTLGFLGLATFSAVLLTDPLASAVAVGGLVALAAGMALAFRQRTFCRFVCPVGGFLGLYASAAPVAVRSKDSGVCAGCRDRGCVAGNERAWGCPWLERPHSLQRANACGLCLECVKACPHENISVYLRPPFSERRLTGWDEGAKAFLMLAVALAYTAVYLGPWGWLKDAADGPRGGNGPLFAGFAAGLWAFALLVLPGGFALAVGLGRRLAGGSPVGWKTAFLAAAAATVPLGLLGWIAFTVPIALTNGSYVLRVASDPFGWGWDLFGSAGLPWSPVGTSWSGLAAAAIILAGQALALRVGWLEALAVYGPRRRALLGFAPTATLVTGLAIAFLWLHVG